MSAWPPLPPPTIDLRFGIVMAILSKIVHCIMQGWKNFTCHIIGQVDFSVSAFYYPHAFLEAKGILKSPHSVRLYSPMDPCWVL